MSKNPIVHFEIPADNLERAKKFYTKIFGWKIVKFPMPKSGSTDGDPYYMVYSADTDKNHMVKNPGEINGGMMKRKERNQPFMNYISVSSIDKMLPKIKASKGKLAMPKTEIGPGMGWIAAFKDTEGNLIGLHEYDRKATQKPKGKSKKKK